MKMSKSLIEKMEKVSANMDISEVPQEFKEKTLEAVEQLKREGKIIEETDGNLRLTELGKKNIHGILDNPAFKGIKNISFLEDTHCILCNKKLKDKGNNALPLADGRCCDDCNANKVLPARIENQKKGTFIAGEIEGGLSREFTPEEEKGIDMLEELQKEGKAKVIDKTIALDLSKEDKGKVRELLKNPLFKRLDKVHYTHNDITKEFDFTEEDVWFDFFNIPENDRFKTYQLLVNAVEGMLTQLKRNGGSDKTTEEFQQSYLKSLKQSIIFEVEDDLIPAFTHSPECSSALLPYKSTFLNARVPIDNRIYLGVHIGSYYSDNEKPVMAEDKLNNEMGMIIDLMEKTKGMEEINKTGETRTGYSTYNAVLTCYLEKDKEEKWQMHPDLFPLFILPSTIEEMFQPLDKYQKKLKNFVLATLNYFSEPDVSLAKHEFSKMNEERRIKKGRMPLPLLSMRVVVHGKLRVYVDKFNEDYEKSDGKRKRKFSHSFKVRANWFHFRNKKRYKKVYSLSDIDLDRLHYEKIKDRITGEDLIRVKRKDCVKGEGLLLKKSYKVEE